MPDNLRRILVAFVVFSSLVAGVYAQSGTLQSGYVIVTPSFGDVSRLTAFETFRFKGKTTSTQASVLDSTLTTNASIFVSSDFASERYFGLALVNPADVVATVDLKLYRADGTVVTTSQVQVQPQRQISLFVTELFRSLYELQAGFSGLLNLVSSNPIGVVGLRFQGQDFSPVPVIHNLAFVPMVPPRLNGAGGPGALLLPQLVSGGEWRSEIVLTNTSLGPITVRVDFFSTFGVSMVVPLTTGAVSTLTGITIPPNGTVVLETAY
jgi:hypothetical protein